MFFSMLLTANGPNDLDKHMAPKYGLFIDTCADQLTIRKFKLKP